MIISSDYFKGFFYLLGLIFSSKDNPLMINLTSHNKMNEIYFSGNPRLDLVSPGGVPERGVEHSHHRGHGREGQCPGLVHQGGSLVNDNDNDNDNNNDNHLSQESWDKSYPEPDLRLIIIDGTKEEEGWQAPAVLSDQSISMLEQAGWGLCHMEMPDYMKKQTIPQVVSIS